MELESLRYPQRACKTNVKIAAHTGKLFESSVKINEVLISFSLTIRIAFLSVVSQKITFISLVIIQWSSRIFIEIFVKAVHTRIKSRRIYSYHNHSAFARSGTILRESYFATLSATYPNAFKKKSSIYKYRTQIFKAALTKIKFIKSIISIKRNFARIGKFVLCILFDELFTDFAKRGDEAPYNALTNSFNTPPFDHERCKDNQ